MLLFSGVEVTHLYCEASLRTKQTFIQVNKLFRIPNTVQISIISAEKFRNGDTDSEKVIMNMLQAYFYRRPHLHIIFLYSFSSRGPNKRTELPKDITVNF